MTGDGGFVAAAELRASRDALLAEAAKLRAIVALTACGCASCTLVRSWPTVRA